jgi:hypothetical protein
MECTTNCSINCKRFFAASIAVFIFVWAFELLLHGKLLTGMYMETMNLWRPEDEMKMPFLFASQMFFSIFVVWLFTRHYEAKGIAEGCRYGLWVGLILGSLPLAVYCYMPIPLTMVIAWVTGEFLKGLGAGIVTSLVYRNETATATTN